jgi:hypothetical protein
MTTCIHAQMADVRSPGPPSDVRGPVSGVQTSRSDRLPDTACPVASGRTRSPPSGTPLPNRKRRGQATDDRHGRIRTSSDNHNQEDDPPDAGPLLWAGACGSATNDRSAMARLPARPSPPQRSGSCSVSHRAPGRASAHCCPQNEFRVERRANSDASSVMAGASLQREQRALEAALWSRSGVGTGWSVGRSCLRRCVCLDCWRVSVTCRRSPVVSGNANALRRHG